MTTWKSRKISTEDLWSDKVGMRPSLFHLTSSKVLCIFALLITFFQFTPFLYNLKFTQRETCEDVISHRITKKLLPEFKNLNTRMDILGRKIGPNHVSIDDGQEEEPFKKIPVLIISYNRPVELKSLIEKILYYMPKNRFSLYVSQDGNKEDVEQVVKSFGENIAGHFQRVPQELKLPSHYQSNEKKGYYYLSQHYKFAVDSVFVADSEADRLIILEEDLDISFDFFNYFGAMSPLLDEDPSLFCVSAYNDNGMVGFVEEPDKVFRSDFFSGLGWMLKKETWVEWREDWPLGYWDEFVRKTKQRKGRSCIRPEISRTYHKCTEKGVSLCQFNKFLSNGKLDSVPVDWNLLDLTLIGNKDLYDKWLKDRVASAEETTVQDLRKENSPHDFAMRDFKIVYNSMEDFKGKAKGMGVMNDEKAGVPRMAYLGIVTFRFKGNTIFISPNVDNLLYNNEDLE